jgi:hypothetical protein
MWLQVLATPSCLANSYLVCNFSLNAISQESIIWPLYHIHPYSVTFYKPYPTLDFFLPHWNINSMEKNWKRASDPVLLQNHSISTVELQWTNQLELNWEITRTKTNIGKCNDNFCFLISHDILKKSYSKEYYRRTRQWKSGTNVNKQAENCNQN